MLLSTEIDSFYKYGDNKSIVRLLKNGGFDACDFSMFLNNHNDSFIDKANYVELAKDLRKFADDEGMVFNQSHSPFPSARINNEPYNVAQLDKLKRALEVSGILGVKNCVVHPCNDYSPEENAERVYLPLLETAKAAGVTIALENMWNWNNEKNCAAPAACSSPANFNAHLDALPSEYFCACLDIGHAEMEGVYTSAEEMILSLNNRLKAIHLHDNDKHNDNHKEPFSLKVDFAPIIAALKKINYSGDITFESNSFIANVPLELYPAAVTYLAAIGNYFRKQISNG